MAEKATKGGDKYYVFYYDVQRGVELAARLPDKTLKDRTGAHRVKLQIRAKTLDGNKTPRIAHFDMYMVNRKHPCFERADPTEWVETRMFIDQKTGQEKTIENIFEPGTLRETAAREKREMGLVHERPISDGPKLAMHGSPERKSKLASNRHTKTIDATMQDVGNFTPGIRNVVFGRTIKALTVRSVKKNGEIAKIKEEKPQLENQNKTAKQKTKQQNKQRVDKAGENHIPKVYVKTADGCIERLTFEAYEARFAKTKEPKKRLSDRKAEAEMQAEAAQHPASSPVPRAYNPIPHKADDVVLYPSKPRKPRSTAALDCEDPLYVLVKEKNEHVKRVEAPRVELKISASLMKKRETPTKERNDITSSVGSGYEIWILKKEPAPEKPHFFVVRRSEKGAIQAAARFNFSRKDNHEATLCADLWPYNEDYPNVAPLTHPTHNMYTHHSPPPLKKAQEIADIFANDALAAWHEHYDNISPSDNLVGRKPDTHISETQHKGPLLSEILKPVLKAVA